MSQQSNDKNNNLNKKSLTHLDSIIEIQNANSSSNLANNNNNDNLASTSSPLSTKRNSDQMHLLNVNVVNEESTVKMISASACSIATTSGNKKFRLKSSSATGGSGVGGGLLASLKNTTLTASKIITRATSTSRSSSPTNTAKNALNMYHKSLGSGSNEESLNEQQSMINQSKKTAKLKSFKHSAIENDIDSGELKQFDKNEKETDDEDDDDDDDDFKKSKLNLNYSNLLKQNTSSYKEMVSNMNRTIDLLASHSNINEIDSNRQILPIHNNNNKNGNNIEYEDDEDGANANLENVDSVQKDLDEMFFLNEPKKHNNKQKKHFHRSSQPADMVSANEFNNIKLVTNRANSFTNTKNRSIKNENQVPLITTENMDLMSINTDDEYSTTTSNKLSKPILYNSNRNINLLASSSNTRHSTVSFSDTATLVNDCSDNNLKSNETLIINKSQRIDLDAKINENLLLDDPKLQFIDSLPPSPKQTLKNQIANTIDELNIPINTQLSAGSKMSTNLIDLNASLATSTNKTFISSTSISTLNQSRSIKLPPNPANLKLIKPMTTGSKAMRIMGNNSAFMGNGPLKNQLSGGSLSNKSSGSSNNKGKKTPPQKRLFFKNGNINISRSNIDKRRRRYLTDIFTTLIDLKWRYNVLVFSLGFLVSWISFAAAWYLISFLHGDLNHINDPNYIACISGIHSFIGAILFSIETQQTIGYGARYTTEKCPEAIFVMMVQSSVGVMIQSFMVGVVFAKLSRPKKRSETLMFSKNAVISLRDGRLCLICRVGDMRKSHIVEAHVRMYLIKKKVTLEGEILPLHMYDLNVGWDKGLDRLFLVWPLTIEHYIDQNSPFWTISAEDLKKERFELAVILEGIVESTGMTTQARSSYLVNEILWGHRFEKLITFQKEDGTYKIDYSRFNMTVPIDTPTCSAKELEELKEQEAYITDALQDSTPSTTASAEIFNSERKKSQKEATEEDDESKLKNKIKNDIKMVIEDHSTYTSNNENDKSNVTNITNISSNTPEI